MSKIINFARVIRRNWKKSVFFFGILSYGGSYGVERYRTFEMMRAYCEEAKAFGEKLLPNYQKPKHVTVILNPEANNKKANVQFEKFAAPLLHLAGFKVSIFKTEHEKQAQDLMEVMSNTDAVLVAGGNGTLHEVITGLMRRADSEEGNLPLGVIPMGKTNTVAHRLFGSKSFSHAQLMAEAAMAVIREQTVSLDVMKVQFADEEKPVFAACSFEQGVFAEVEPKVEKYWYLGALKDKFAYFVNSFKNYEGINYKQLQYVAPCNGCSNCYMPQKIKDNMTHSGKWWRSFVPRKADAKVATVPEYSKVLNEDCGKSIPMESTFSNFSIFTSSVKQSEKDDKKLFIKYYSKDLSFKEFIMSGLSHRKSKLESSNLSTIVKAREVNIENEVDSDSQEQFCYIDSEKYKMSSCNVMLIPKQIVVYG